MDRLDIDLVIDWSQDGLKTVPRGLLDPSWTGLEAILGPSWGQKSGSRRAFSNVC